MANIVKNTTIQTDGIDLLLSQLRGKDNFEAFISCFLSVLQAAEDDVFQIRYAQKLDDAYGDMLDKWGEMVGISRQGRADDEYRIQIKAKIAINISKGTIDEVASIFNLLTGATHTEVFERFPREVSLFSNADLDDEEFLVDPPFGYSGNPDVAGYGEGHYATTISADLAYLLAIMDRVLAAGYRIGTISYVPGGATPFGYSGNPDVAGYGAGAYATSI